MKKLESGMTAFKKNLEEALTGDGFGASRIGSMKMSIQPRKKISKSPDSANDDLIAYAKVNPLCWKHSHSVCLQRQKKPRRDAGDERQELEAVRRELLQIEAGTKCFVCSEAINKPIELQICAICTRSMHQRCRAVHEEDCGKMDVTFESSVSTGGKQKKKTTGKRQAKKVQLKS
jgi:hypothetical protein